MDTDKSDNVTEDTPNDNSDNALINQYDSSDPVENASSSNGKKKAKRLGSKAKIDFIRSVLFDQGSSKRLQSTFDDFSKSFDMPDDFLKQLDDELSVSNLEFFLSIIPKLDSLKSTYLQDSGYLKLKKQNEKLEEDVKAFRKDKSEMLKFLKKKIT